MFTLGLSMRILATIIALFDLFFKIVILYYFPPMDLTACGSSNRFFLSSVFFTLCRSSTCYLPPPSSQVHCSMLHIHRAIMLPSDFRHLLLLRNVPLKLFNCRLLTDKCCYITLRNWSVTKLSERSCWVCCLGIITLSVTPAGKSHYPPTVKF